jgi:hypothetical protein
LSCVYLFFFMKLSCVYLDDWFHLVPPVLFIWFCVHFKNLKRSLVRSWFIPYPFYDPIIGESYAGCMCNRLGWMQVKHLLTLMICLHDFAKQLRTAEAKKQLANLCILYLCLEIQYIYESKRTSCKGIGANYVPVVLQP